ncbi:MAG: S16 family serine protease, partial [Cyanobacteria bacterium J06628_6]
SAGVTMVTAIASLLRHQPVRTDTAMTGEIDLSGDVLPIGGLREKVLAAHRAGIRRVLLPQRNQKDLADIPPSVRQEMEFVSCDRIEQVLQQSLLPVCDLSDAALSTPLEAVNGALQSAL